MVKQQRREKPSEKEIPEPRLGFTSRLFSGHGNERKVKMDKNTQPKKNNHKGSVFQRILFQIKAKNKAELSVVLMVK